GHTQWSMSPARKPVRRHVDDVAVGLDRLDRRAGSDAAHDWHGNRAPAFVLRGAPHPAKIAFDHARRESAGAARADAVRDRLWQLDHLDGAGTIGQAADEPALL